MVIICEIFMQNEMAQLYIGNIAYVDDNYV